MRLFCDWDSLKQKISSGITLYYYEYSTQYEIFIIEGETVWFSEVWKDTTNTDGLNLEDNTAHLIDFENNYKDNAELL